ncbi:MAG: helix-turn-helix transcriptional regulator [Lachnospiraceae bacterium]|nr:helix-turn-helix transcriptional regulator [Lachnospiraceae bacterium]
MIDENIGVRIREVREEKHLTREQLAEQIDVSAKFIYEIESGKKSFSVDILYKFSNELSVSADWILFGDDVHKKEADEVVRMLNEIYDICNKNHEK